MSVTSSSQKKAPGAPTPRTSRVYQLTDRKADMTSISNNTAPAPSRAYVIDLQDRINQNIDQARGVLVALTANDSFVVMRPEQVAACLALVRQQLEVIEQNSQTIVDAIA